MRAVLARTRGVYNEQSATHFGVINGVRVQLRKFLTREDLGVFQKRLP